MAGGWAGAYPTGALRLNPPRQHTQAAGLPICPQTLRRFMAAACPHRPCTSAPTAACSWIRCPDPPLPCRTRPHASQQRQAKQRAEPHRCSKPPIGPVAFQLAAGFRGIPCNGWWPGQRCPPCLSGALPRRLLPSGAVTVVVPEPQFGTRRIYLQTYQTAPVCCQDWRLSVQVPLVQGAGDVPLALCHCSI